MKYLKPMLITGCTASGKSELAMNLANINPSVIINADALQVYDAFSILTSRPNNCATSSNKHELYGHVSYKVRYDVNVWLRQIMEILKYAKKNNLRPIIVGGTGLYFTALTEGLSEIPNISDEIRIKANKLCESNPSKLLTDIKKKDPETYNAIDLNNLVRVQRAWEVLTETGFGLSFWHKNKPPPLLNLKDCRCIIFARDNITLSDNIEKRFKKMISLGVIEEVEEVMKDCSNGTKLPALQAIGFAELREYLRGSLTLEDAEKQIIIRTKQYAKRQRTWFRTKFKGWEKVILNTKDFKNLSQSIDK